ncbi:MAG: hypothetical protein ACT4P5_02515 [Armatimonadota bacterium]
MSFDGIELGLQEFGHGRECFLCGIEGLEARVEAQRDWLGGVTPGGLPVVHVRAFDPPD